MKVEYPYDRIQKDFETSPFFKLLGFRFVELTEDEVILELPIEEKLLNTAGNLHGGVYATLIDNIIGLKLRSMYGQPMITVDLNVKYIAPINRGRITAKAKVFGNGRKIKMGEGEVYDQDGNLLAKGYGTFKVVKG
ncbi:PaaI family thioesterase [Pseudalkalibacillus decolorationis]|uniref:PaaI family thioesterase n=1 Tax=Pseudalkalibacillus decolorationis TaxID=163879 RepID=UPI002147FAD8|nr:PaaI family thioesterase [Pseudalkalibacillus decolorationis]